MNCKSNVISVNIIGNLLLVLQSIHWINLSQKIKHQMPVCKTMWKYIFKVGSTNSIGNAQCLSVTRTHIFLIFTILLLCHIFKKENPFWEEFFFSTFDMLNFEEISLFLFWITFCFRYFLPNILSNFYHGLGYNLMFLTYIFKPSIFPNYGWKIIECWL